MPVSSGFYSDLLTNFATGYRNGKYVADLVMPDIPVDKHVGTFRKRRLIDVITPYDDVIGQKGEPGEIDYETDTAEYVCLDRGNKFTVTQQELEEADAPLQPVQQEKLALLLNNLMLKREIRVADILNTTTSYTSANRITATAAWSDETSANIVKDIQEAKASINPGAETETKLVGVMALELWQEAQRHPQLLGLMARDESGMVTEAGFKAFFGLDELYISDALKNTAVKGQTAVKARIWDTDKFCMVRIPKMIVSKNATIFGGRFVKPQNGTAQNAIANQDLVNVGVWEWIDISRGPGDGVHGGKATLIESDPVVLQDDMGAIVHSA